MLQGSQVPVLLRPTRVLQLRLFFDLFKLRIGLVIGLTAIAGLAVAHGSSLPAWRVFALALAVTMAAAAAGAFNQMAERDLDARMRRTRNRAFVTGRLTAGPAWLAAIAATGATGIALAAFALNAMTAIYIFLGAFTYAVVYTIWLKRRTWWNIVIGGLAGSFAVLAGAAAVSPQRLEALPLAFAIVLFLWTPPHFWSLAIAFHDDYAAAKVPMLPVVIGDARAARTIFACAALLVAASLVPAVIGMGALYLTTAIGAGAYLLVKSAQLLRAPNQRAAMANFHASLAYLALLIGAAIADASLKL
ncbi:Protoheme IX farnesyltransferase 2 [Burkholderiales bacterium]|jgi:protoheme IX farnesyltransferase|nr:Protoheme IX farnesyltransferase 2 [Burkholderiales bacterium]